MEVARPGEPGALGICHKILKFTGLAGIGTVFLCTWKSFKYLFTSAVPLVVLALYLIAVWSMHLFQNDKESYCVIPPNTTLTSEQRSSYDNDPVNWLLRDDGTVQECGNRGNFKACPEGYDCVSKIVSDSGPWKDIPNFNNIFSSYAAVLVIALNDYGEWICNHVLMRKGDWYIIFFLLIIMITYCLATTILAVVSAACDKVWKKQKKNNVGEPKNDANKERYPDIPYIDNGHTEDHEAGIIVRPPSSPKTACQSCLDATCGWECCICCDTVKNYTHKFMFDPFMQLFIVFWLLFSTFAMIADHHNMDDAIAWHHLKIFYVSTFIFAVEAILKIIALSPRGYFRENWNIFEFFLAVFGVLELTVESVVGLRLFGLLLLLRIVRLARFWPIYENMNNMNNRAFNTRWQILLILGIFVTVMAVIGMNVHGSSYETYFKVKGTSMRWHTIDFPHSFMIVFRAICGEWIESYMDCVDVSGGWSCLPFYFFVVVIGDLLMVNIFTMMLLWSSLPRSDAKPKDEVTSMVDILNSAVDRFVNSWNWLVARIGLRFLICQFPSLEKANRSQSLEPTTPGILADENVTYVALKEELRGMENVDNQISGPGPCCYEPCYKYIPESCCDFNCWAKLRSFCYAICTHNIFEIIITLLIIFSTITMGLDDATVKNNYSLYKFVSIVFKIIPIVYTIEITIRLIGLGFKGYFSSGWRICDFIVVLVLLIYWIVAVIGIGPIPILRNCICLRLLRVLSLTWTFDSARVVFNTMLESVPGMVNVWIVGFLLWNVYAIVGVQLFAGKFYSCVDPDGTRLNTTLVESYDSCLMKNFTWENKDINFDNIINAHLALIQVATFKGWIDVMHNAADSKMINDQPETEVNYFMVIYFVIFIIFCSYNIYVMWFGTLIDGYNRQRIKTEKQMGIKGQGDVIYVNNISRLQALQPTKPRQPFQSQFQAMANRIITDVKFDIAVATAIILNFFTLAYHHISPSDMLANAIFTFSLLFIIVFTVELLLRVTAQRADFFKDFINVVDAVVLLLAIISISFHDVIAHYEVPPTLLRIIRLGYIVHFRRWLHRFERISCLISALIRIVPHLLVISVTLFVVIVIYAVVGVNSFQNVKRMGFLNEYLNFDTLPSALIILSQIFVSSGWDGVMIPLIQQKDCYTIDHNCGSVFFGALYCVSFVLITYVCIFTTLTVIILGTYTEVKSSSKLTRSIDDLSQGFYKAWIQYDSTCTGFIALNDLPSFLEMQDEPFTINKPNSKEIVVMDIPICKGNLVHHIDVFDALFRRHLAKEGKPVACLSQIGPLNHQEKDYEPVSSTLWRKREEKSAGLIQRTWSAHKQRTMM